MIIHIMGLNEREHAASVVAVVGSVVAVVVEAAALVAVVLVLSTSHAKISPWYWSNHARFASTVARAAVAAD
jgi:hypothetical protein